MLSSNLLKSKIPICVCVCGEFMEFNAEFKFAKIQNSHLCVCEGGGVGGTNFQLLMLSPNLPKKKKFSGKNWNGFVSSKFHIKFIY